MSTEKGDGRCVVADIRTPGMSGTELKHATTAAAVPTPVIVTTALAGDQWLVLAENSGASFLRMPFDPTALFGLVTRNLAA